MNSLSILIYVVGIAEKIENNIGGAGVISALLLIGFTFAYAVTLVLGSGTDSYNASERETANTFKPFAKSGLRWSIVLVVVLSFLNFFFPTKQTMILIAASEVSEKIVTSEMAQKALNSTVSGLTQVGGVSSDALLLLKTYIAKEQAELSKELAGNLMKDIK